MKTALWYDITVVTVLSICILVGCGDGGGGNAPVISNIVVSELTSNSCIITWRTDRNAESQVDYGLDANYGQTESNTKYTMNHAIHLTDLQASTTYHYKIISVGMTGRTSSSDDKTFKANDPDTIAPEAPSGLIALPGDGQLTISWTTNTEPDVVGYNIYRSTSEFIKINTALIVETTYTDEDVTNGTTYNYAITAVDSSGNESEKSGEAGATPSPDTGAISVTSTPAGAVIIIDDTDTGQVTPYTFTNKPVGTYTVKVSMKDYACSPESIDVNVMEGQTTNADFELSPLVGSIEVTSTPSGADISINSVNTGQVTPYTFTNKPVGTYTIAVSLTGYTSTPDSVDIEVLEKQTIIADFELSPLVGSIEVTSTPSGANISIDGVDTGQVTPYTFSNKPVGTYIVAVSLTGYTCTPDSVDIEVLVGQTVNADFILTLLIGSIEIDSAPVGAVISINGVDTGQVTPYTFTDKPVGTYIVAVSLTGYTCTPETIAIELLEGHTAVAGFILANQKPSACFNIHPQSGNISTNYYFDARCSNDPEEGNNLLYRWDWENDEIWDTEYSSSATRSHQYDVVNTFTVKLETKDSIGAIDSATKTVSVVIKDDMVNVPAGSFVMGDTFNDMFGIWMEWTRPTRTVYLDAYWIGKYEISNEKYVSTLNWANDQGYLKNSAGGAYTDGDVFAEGVQILRTSSSYCMIEYDADKFEVVSAIQKYHPVVEISWYGAVLYCNWLSERGKRTPCYNTKTWECNFNADGYRLPTEAEWEKAAAHDPHKTAYQAKRRFPWGDNWTCNNCNNSECGSGTTTKVGSYSAGKSYYGCYDIAGNVWELCNDWHQEYNGLPDPDSNPIGPDSGTFRIIRGGSWNSSQGLVISAARDGNTMQNPHRTIGFRIARRD